MDVLPARVTGVGEAAIEFDHGPVRLVQRVAVLDPAAPLRPGLPDAPGQAVRALNAAHVPVLKDGVDARRVRAEQFG